MSFGFNLSIRLIIVSLIALKREYRHQLIGTRNTWNNTYDYIVVGAGSAGAVVANRLSENRSVSVLLLEAGGPQSVITDTPVLWPELSGTRFDWNYTTVSQKNIGLASNGLIPEPRGHVIGGTSTINAMVYSRGNRRTFDDWVHTYGAKGWSYDEVLPLFIKSENNTNSDIVDQNPGYHGTDGPIGVSSDMDSDFLRLNMKALNELGFPTIDINGAKQLGTAFVQNTWKDGIRQSTGNAYLEPNPHPNNLHILTDALVTKILFRKSSEKLNAIGVQFMKNKDWFEVRANKEVILCDGAYNSPKLLLLSGIGPKEHLKNMAIDVKADLPVGENLQNHPFLMISATIRDDINVSLGRPPPQLNVQQLYELFVNKTGSLAQSSGLITYYSTRDNDVKEWPNSGFFTFISAISNDFSNSIAKQMYKLDENISEYSQYSGSFALLFEPILFRPKSYGSVRLASNDPFVQPLIDPNFLSNVQDLEELTELAKFIYYFIEKTWISNYVYLDPEPIPGCQLCTNTSKYFYECDSYIKCVIRQTGGSFLHPVGTCRMGAVNRTDVVVDPELRVKGIGGLRVCDASNMPRIPNANTNPSAIMIGEKCSQLIKK